MCEFCVKHGEGKKWYLEARNYSDDLLSDLRRRKFIANFLSDTEGTRWKIEKLDLLEKLPSFVQRVIKHGVVRHQKSHHYGQVVPFEDIERILGFVNSIVRIACYCRHISLGGAEKRYCYGLSMGPDGGRMSEIMQGLSDSFLFGPDSKGIETLDKAVALEHMRKLERQGLCHTIWTFHTPFIGAICNCDRADCLAMHTTVTHQLPVMFRAEYVAVHDPDSCKGCRQCMKVCQFGAIGYSAADKKIFIDPRRCYGCGICRTVCKQDAIRLEDRRSVPVAANLW